MEPKPAQHLMTWDEAYARSSALSDQLPAGCKVYGVPRGGTTAALLLAVNYGHVVVHSPEEADAIVDDIVDSGRTMDHYMGQFPGIPFLALVDKVGADRGLGWVVFPWDATREGADAEDAVARLIQYCGDDPAREGMAETPARYAKALLELTAGLREDPRAHLRKAFPLGDAGDVSSYDELILSRDIPFVSLCEHHLMPFYGAAHLAYIPGDGGRVVGLSKLARMLDGYARRFQVQERLTRQCLDAMVAELSPVGAAVVIKSTHTCQCWRGVRKDGQMVTSAMSGVFRTDNDARAELLSLLAL